MKIIATGDWHIGNMFHGNDRLAEHNHFFKWLLGNVEEQQPDALLIAGDVFDTSNPSAAAQSVYYEFLAEATKLCPEMKIIIIAGNHDSAFRLEAPRSLLSRHNVEIRGSVPRVWCNEEGKGQWKIEYDELMIPLENKEGEEAVVLCVPYLRNDLFVNSSYSEGVNRFLHQLTDLAREKYPEKPLVMMAHMYAKGSDIASKDASEKIVIGGQEEVNMEGWKEHPDYMASGHIHKRQHIWNTDWARYMGSVLPMSFAEIDYMHGVDVITISKGCKPTVDFLEYVPQHKLVVLPNDSNGLSLAKLKKLIKEELPDRNIQGELDENFVYLLLKLELEKVNNDDIKELEKIIETKNAVLCKIQKVITGIELKTLSGDQKLESVDDILDRDPLETLKEAFVVKFKREMNPRQEEMLKSLISLIKEEE